VINISEFKKAYFNIDNCQDYYEGYYIPHKRWNGWAMPYFSKKIADKIIKKAQADDMKIVYDKKSQSYKVTDYVQGVEDDSYEFEKVVIDTPEGKKSLYGVGAGYWVWDDYSLDEIDNPNAIIVPLNNHNELCIEFHPGDVIFFMNDKKIGCTGPDYSIRVIPIDEYIELTRDLCYENKLFLLPMVEVKEYEEMKLREIVGHVISNFNIKKSCEKQIVEIIINNCLSLKCGAISGPNIPIKP